MGKIFAKDMTDKWLIPNINKQFLQLNIKNINNPIKKKKWTAFSKVKVSTVLPRFSLEEIILGRGRERCKPGSLGSCGTERALMSYYNENALSAKGGGCWKEKEKIIKGTKINPCLL